MGPPITAEKCWQALAEVLSCEGETKRSGNTVNIRLLVLMREQEGVFLRDMPGKRPPCMSGHFLVTVSERRMP